MTDLERILVLWHELESAAADFVLATVVAVEGPSYRKPGALMLLTADGRRAGTISGGCLEAQVASRAWWLTAEGPCIQHYSTAEDDGDRPFGSGCGGVVHLLLERRATAQPFLAALDGAFSERSALAVATVLEGPLLGRRAFAGTVLTRSAHSSMSDGAQGPAAEELQTLADRSQRSQTSMESKMEMDGRPVKAWSSYRPARPGLAIFGAGDDALPLARLAKELGWFVTLADGRSHLVKPERFPAADALSMLSIADLPVQPGVKPIQEFARIQPGDAVVVMSHSFEQDSKILASLLQLQAPPAYIGVLGPQRRTRELLAEAGRLLSLPEAEISTQVDRWMGCLHAPTGLDLGAESPETIALSILAEIQKERSIATALPLRDVRGAALAAMP